MSQLPEIPASTYTLEMDTLGAISDIPTFEGESVPVSCNLLTFGTRPLQLLPLPGTEFLVCYETSAMRGFQTELRHATVGRDCSSARQGHGQLRGVAIEMRGAAVKMRGASVLRTQYFEQLRGTAIEVRDAAVLQVDLGKARAGGSSTDASAFWDLLDPPMHARVVAAGFGDYAAGLRRTQPRFPPAMRYALMERFDGPVAPLDARYQTATLGAQLVHSLLGVTTQTRYTAQGCVSYEVIYRF
ncbi:hypothetical protein JCGZ_01178 [Jatropha curcas]|uniref:Uncharacterized protein n=1 Tax=Jatropha curcas TaxID=180498 RepID=A0A067JGP5_JATCU|nr:hypothetical protein JCGZ_01178 [Jatropha curcas]